MLPATKRRNGRVDGSWRNLREGRWRSRARLWIRRTGSRVPAGCRSRSGPGLRSSAGGHRRLAIGAEARELNAPVLDMEAATGFLGCGEGVELLVVDVDDRLALPADQVMMGLHVDVVARLVVERIDLHDDPQRLERLEVL